MPTCLSPVVELLVEAERRRMIRVQSGNLNLFNENEQLMEEIRDLRHHIQRRQDALERRRARQDGFRGGIVAPVLANY